jgi:predicted O-methyltransferase YrrM
LKYLKIYESKEPDAGQSVPTKEVLELSENLLNAGRILVTDNFYTRIELAKKLLQRKTYLLGTLRKNRKGNPPEVVKKKLKRGNLSKTT